MTIATVETTLIALENELAALGDPGDVSLTYNAQAEFARRQSSLTGRISTIRMAQRTLAEVEPQLAADIEWLAMLNTWRATLNDELDALPPVITRTTLGDGAEMVSCRSALQEAQARGLSYGLLIIERGLRVLSETGTMLETCRLGELMRASGFTHSEPAPPGEVGARLPWRGSVPLVERRIRELQQRRDDARARLDNAR
jgi:hypothetical protein